MLKRTVTANCCVAATERFQQTPCAQNGTSLRLPEERRISAAVLRSQAFPLKKANSEIELPKENTVGFQRCEIWGTPRFFLQFPENSLGTAVFFRGQLKTQQVQRGFHRPAFLNGRVTEQNDALHPDSLGRRQRDVRFRAVVAGPVRYVFRAVERNERKIGVEF